MTVDELITCLSTFDRSAEVLVTWEGVLRSLDPSLVYKRGGDGAVLIDGDDGHYKKMWTEERP